MNEIFKFLILKYMIVSEGFTEGTKDGNMHVYNS